MINLALAAQRQENFSDALKWADKALKCAPAPVSLLPQAQAIFACSSFMLWWSALRFPTGTCSEARSTEGRPCRLAHATMLST